MHKATGAGLADGAVPSSTQVRGLFEPAPRLLGAAERRQARLLSILQFTHIWVFAATAGVMRFIEPEPLRTAGALTLLGASIATIGSYALSRTRHVTTAAWWYLLVNLAVGPAVILLCPQPGAAFIKIAFLLVSVTLTNVLASTRATLICSVVGLGSTLLALFASSAPTPGEVTPAIVFFVTNVALIVVFGLHRDRVEADRSVELRTRNAELEALRRTLEERIAARTAELSLGNAQMRLVLDNVGQGIFTVDRAGVISSVHSAVLTRWFGPVEGNAHLQAYFGRRSVAFGDALGLGWQQVRDDVLPVELALEQMPSIMALNGKYFRFTFAEIQGSERYLGVISDVTAELEHEVVQREKREVLSLFEHVLADRSGFMAFIDEGTQTLAKIVSPDTERAEFTRALHTLKGNATLFGIETVSVLCHEVEDLVASGERPLEAADLVRLAERWAAVKSNVDRLLGDRRHVIEITPEQHAALEQAIRKDRPRAELLHMLQELKLEAVEQRLQQFAELARQIAARLAKRASVEVTHDGLRLDRKRWAPLWAALVHAVRNAVDHGVEPPSERARLGKPSQGAISLRAQREGEDICIELADDGRGIDWEGVRLRCVAKGLSGDTHEELVAALFGGGVSTAAEVTDLSGRGVGMGALRSAVVELGGQLDVKSERGSGTRLRMTFPAAASQ